MTKTLIVDDSATKRKIIMRVVHQADLELEPILEPGNGVEGLEVCGGSPA